MKAVRLLILLLVMSCAVPVSHAMPVSQSIEMQPASTAQGGVGHIRFTAAATETTFRVYSITGQLVRVVKVPAEQTVTIDVPKGFYIVKCEDRWSRKVVVK